MAKETAWPNTVSAFLHYESDREYTREEGVLDSSVATGYYEPGLVLGKITSSGKYKPVDSDSSDGSETLAALLVEGVDHVDGTDSRVAVIVRGPAVLVKSGINYNEQTEATIDTALEKLGFSVKSAAY